MQGDLMNVESAQRTAWAFAAILSDGSVVSWGAARTLLGAPGIATRNKKLLGAPGLTTRSKDAAKIATSNKTSLTTSKDATRALGQPESDGL